MTSWANTTFIIQFNSEQNIYSFTISYTMCKLYTRTCAIWKMNKKIPEMRFTQNFCVIQQNNRWKLTNSRAVPLPMMKSKQTIVKQIIRPIFHWKSKSKHRNKEKNRICQQKRGNRRNLQFLGRTRNKAAVKAVWGEMKKWISTGF